MMFWKTKQKKNEEKLKKELKKFNKEMENEKKKYMKLIRKDRFSTHKYLQSYEAFLQKAYTKNSSRFNLYLDRYYYLDYKDGYFKNISFGIMSSVAVALYIYYQDAVKSFFDIVWKSELDLGNSILINTLEFLIKTSVVLFVALLIVGVLFMILVYLDNQLFQLINKDIKTLLVNIERNCVKKLIHDEFKINL